MPIPLLGAALIAGGTALGGIISGFIKSKAVKTAAEIQTEGFQSGIDLQSQQFDKIQELLNPYVTAGNNALQQQQALSGALGPQAQQQAISGIQSSPEFTAIAQQGENAILQNASATGGLRGGNTQGALGQFRPQILSSLINQKFNQLGGLSQLGQASAQGIGQAGAINANNISNLLTQSAGANANAQLAGGQAFANIPGNLSAGLGVFTGLGGFNTQQPVGGGI